MFFSVFTLGCKLNQLETEALTDSFSRSGFSLVHPGEKEPDIIIINTCTVTSMAEQKARRIIRKVLSDYREACVIVTGCYAQLNKAGLAAMDEGNSGRLFIVPGNIKDRLMDLAAYLSALSASEKPNPSALREKTADWVSGHVKLPENSQDGPLPPTSEDGTFRFSPERFSSHSRGFIKIQDGCDRSCTYCRVRLARGKSRSLNAEKILEQLCAMEDRGIAEAVLTGVNISQYSDPGKESGLKSPLKSPPEKRNLPFLLDFLLKGTEQIRLRLSSLEPDELDDDFFKVISCSRIRPHFHLSVQSGSEKILKKMNRSYTPYDIEKTAARLRSARDDPFLACDIIAGFPGENEEDFEKTHGLCEKIGFAWIHAFHFSRRPGTEAWDFPDAVNEKDSNLRVKRLISLAKKGRAEYLGRWEGREVEAIIEKGKGLAKGYAAAVSENYLKLKVLCLEPHSPGIKIRCKIGKPASSSGFDADAEEIQD